jgi:Raf kinase inhibitor-like YbhB/YbcL family protein
MAFNISANRGNQTAKVETQTLKVTSPAFEHEGTIPARYTCDGAEVNPPLHISGIPDNTVSLAIIAEDPDAPKGVFDHWLVWNIDPANTVEENSTPGITGQNGAGKRGYHGPCPPSSTHRYFFYVFALDTDIDLPAGSDKSSLQQAMERHIIAQGSIMGTYKREQS